MPDAAAIWSTVVASNPCSANSTQACFITSSRTAPRAWSRNVSSVGMPFILAPLACRASIGTKCHVRRTMPSIAVDPGLGVVRAGPESAFGRNPMTHSPDVEVAAPDPDARIAAHTSPRRATLELVVIGLGALVVSLSQSVLVPVLSILPAQPRHLGEQRELAADLDPAGGGRLGADHGPARRHVRQAADAARRGRRAHRGLAGHRAHRRHRLADRRPGRPGRLRRGHPAGHQPARRADAARAGRLLDRADQRDARRRRCARAAAGRLRRRARRLPRAVLDHRRARDWSPSSASSRSSRSPRPAAAVASTWSARSCSPPAWSA